MYCTNGPNNDSYLTIMTDYGQLFGFTLYWLLMKSCGFANFVDALWMR